ncbi:winged helix-turn-helix transcriptional regulator [Pseudomonas gingeri]|uniref:MarR family winged helix-turn-helix transcriptional regulator n=1 Tax=Pseudomonas gingeri TaxID=117681 RepID=UPI0015A20AE7|nr:MarR family winged helix-turn-helix transcriptional regulator [Pseudomonas gingeri]NVZ60723.1 winged helix-turn-helix transcriptional regulator [Pseudomonas gingeri]NVZ75390.1 winged helix-turn-helix transcriptional regulator [Pseudomonas gingeri]
MSTPTVVPSAKLTAATNGVPSLELCNIYAVRRAARWLTQIYDQYLARVGLTSTQFTILALIDKADHLTILQLSDALKMDRTSLVRTLKPLRLSGYIDAFKVSQSSKLLMMSLTAEGASKLEASLPEWEGAQLEINNRWGGEKAEQLRKDLYELTSS